MATITGVPVTAVPAEGDPAYPGMISITISDLVGPLAANRQPNDLAVRDDTLRDRVNTLITSVNDIGEGGAGTTVKFLPRDGTDAMTGALDVGSNKITSLDDATAATDAMNRQASDARYAQLTGDTFTGVLTLDDDPANPLEAATKQYVDAQDAAGQIGYSNFTVLTSDGPFVVPANTSRIMVEIWGGGGGGSSGVGGSGGGGGAYVQAIIAVSESDAFDAVVGGGGAIGVAGADTTFIKNGGGPPDIAAGGGAGAGFLSGGVGGAVGSINGVVSNFSIPGAFGGGGGGGGGASTSSGEGGDAPRGGPGGARQMGGAGDPGIIPGGGGSGGHQSGGAGGVGASGRCVIWF